MSSKRFIVVLDLGSTSIRVHVYDSDANIVFSESERLRVLHPEPVKSEYCPEEIWKSTQNLLNAVFLKFNPSSLAGLGITVMRSSTMLWDRATGKPLTNIISWQDTRGNDLADSWNKSLTFRLFNSFCTFLYKITRLPKYLAGSVLRLRSVLPPVQLLHYFRENPDMSDRAHRGELCFGGNDSWLLWKLTNGRVHGTDYSCASATGMYDLFGLEWSSLVVSSLLRLPMAILPEVRPTASLHGVVDKSIFGFELPITCIVGDQSAATFGERCFAENTAKVTLGTGTFFDWNTGHSPYASMKGLYPQIGWFIEDAEGPVYLVEGSHFDTGTTLEWGKTMGFYDDISSTGRLASEVADSSGVYFVPGFNGIGVPYVDFGTCGALMGLRSHVDRRHVTRAILDAVIFQTKIIAESFASERGQRPTVLYCNGGVSASDYVLQGIADLLDCVVVRKDSCEATSRGCAFLAGLASGDWKMSHLQSLNISEQRFLPNQSSHPKRMLEYEMWKRAVDRCLSWL